MSSRITTYIVPMIALASVCSLAACGGSDNNSTGTNNSTANVRIINASSSTTGLNATAGTTSLASGLNFQNMNMQSTCATIPAGTQSINFTSGSSTSSIGGISNYNFQAGQNYTVVYYGNNNAVVYPESYTAPTSGNYVARFINATSGPLDIYTSAPGATLSSTSTAAVSGLAAGAVSGASTTATGGTFNSYPTGSNFIRAFSAGANPGTATASGSYTIGSMSPTGAQTIVFTSPNAGNGNATAFQVNSCK
jgi:hypothetical protein